MQFERDYAKRAKILAERGIDFAECAAILDNHMLLQVDRKRDYGEERIIGLGALKGRVMVFVYTMRGETWRWISVRHANEQETKRYQSSLAQR